MLQASIACLQDKKLDRPRRLAEELLAHSLNIKRTDLYLQLERVIIGDELQQIRSGLQRLVAGEPIEYVLGEIDFYGCRIKVDQRALIPRLETEVLVDFMIPRIKKISSAWDLCCGSGCIGIALKKKMPDVNVVLSDLSQEALALAKENALLNRVDVQCVEGDLLAPFVGMKTDLMIANPPYLSLQEYFSLDPSVRDFEPKMALVGGRQGTEIYERLAEEMPLFLNPGAQVFLEIGSTQKEEMQKIFSSKIWKSECISDWSGKDRCFFLEIQ